MNTRNIQSEYFVSLLKLMDHYAYILNLSGSSKHIKSFIDGFIALYSICRVCECVNLTIMHCTVGTIDKEGGKKSEKLTVSKIFERERHRSCSCSCSGSVFVELMVQYSFEKLEC